MPTPGVDHVQHAPGALAAGRCRISSPPSGMACSALSIRLSRAWLEQVDVERDARADRRRSGVRITMPWAAAWGSKKSQQVVDDGVQVGRCRAAAPARGRSGGSPRGCPAAAGSRGGPARSSGARGARGRSRRRWKSSASRSRFSRMVESGLRISWARPPASWAISAYCAPESAMSRASVGSMLGAGAPTQSAAMRAGSGRGREIGRRAIGRLGRAGEELGVGRRPGSHPDRAEADEADRARSAEPSRRRGPRSDRRGRARSPAVAAVAVGRDRRRVRRPPRPPRTAAGATPPGTARGRDRRPGAAPRRGGRGVLGSGWPRSARAALRLSLTRSWSSMAITLTCISSPTLQTSATLAT